MPLSDAATTAPTQISALPPLDDFTRAELAELVRVLHGALVRAQADFTTLAATCGQAITVATELAR
jgi:hypothetical protein